MEPLYPMWLFQDTLICASEDDPVHIQVRTRCQGEDFTYSLKTHTAEDTRRWTRVLWEHVCQMSKSFPSPLTAQACCRSWLPAK